MLLCAVSALFNLYIGAFCALYGDGVHVEPPFGWCVTATSLSELWSKQWNTGMSRAFARGIYRPLGGRRRLIFASLAVGIFSGALHEYELFLNLGHVTGSMMTFFVLQMIGTAIEKLVSQYAAALFPLENEKNSHEQTLNMIAIRSLGNVWTLLYIVLTVHYFLVDFGLPLLMMAEKPFEAYCFMADCDVHTLVQSL